MATEYQLVGGQPVKITPLEVTENGTTYAPEGCAFNPVTSSVETNPNTVETITGTLANPWGDYSVSDILSMLADPEYTLRLVLNAGNTVLLSIFKESNSTVGVLHIYGIADDGLDIECFIYTSEGLDIDVRITAEPEEEAEFNDTMPSPAMRSTALTIIHHPLLNE